MISPALTRRRSIPVIVRREDVEQVVRGRRSSRRARRRRVRRAPTRSGLIAVSVLVAASIAWILTFAYLASLG